MTPQKVKPTIAAGLFCIGVLCVMLVGHAWPLWTGDTVYLRVVPVDPRDLFRGEYVTLRYPINSLHRKGTPQAARNPATAATVAFDGDWARSTGSFASRVVYVSLQPRTGADGVPIEHVAVAASDRKPGHGPFLRGRAMLYPWSPTSSGETPAGTTLDGVEVDYGIDAFFVEEGRGRAIEQEIRSGKPVFAEIAVASSGRARVRTLIVGGKRYEPAP